MPLLFCGSMKALRWALWTQWMIKNGLREGEQPSQEHLASDGWRGQTPLPASRSMLPVLTYLCEMKMCLTLAGSIWQIVVDFHNTAVHVQQRIQ